MNKLSIEEKAKAYDELIKRLNKAREDVGCYTFKSVYDVVMSELKESEDERIRKSIINLVEHGFALREDKHRFFDDYSQEQMIAWLEKQGEQKPNNTVRWTPQEEHCIRQLESIVKEEWRKAENIPSDVRVKEMTKLMFFLKTLNPNKKPQEKSALEAAKEENVDNQNCVKPADKVEPKFHEGEWIIHQGTENIYQVIARIDNQYQLKYGDNYTIQKCADVDRCTRLWDITKDAKAGDVLACPNDAGDRDVVFIFKNINSDEGWVFCFCASDANGCFCTNNDYVGNSNSTNISPATKEQRDLLFSKMHDAGYKWDAERKELKKIEQSPAWSEDDKEKINSICNIIADKMSVQKQAYKSYYKNLIDFLKSLRPQNAWKLSDEQMEAIESAVKSYPHVGTRKQVVLLELLEQLKAL